MFRFKGYEGLSSGGAQVGERPEDSLIRVSGGLANDYFRDVAECASNFSRVDLQTTVRVETDVSTLIAEHTLEAHAFADERKRRGEVRLIDSRRHGRTLILKLAHK